MTEFVGGSSRGSAPLVRFDGQFCHSFAVKPTGLDLVLPKAQTLSHHEVRVQAPPELVWGAILSADMAGSSLSKFLLTLRGYGWRVRRGGGGALPERLERFGFTRLRELTGQELVFGLAGQFWRPSGGLRRLADEDAFAAFAEDGCVKAAWNLRIGGSDETSCDLSTETRIACFGDDARRKFQRYWSVVGPFSGMLRRSLLSGIRRRAERAFSAP